MSTTLYARVITPGAWSGSTTRFFSVKDAAREVTAGSDTLAGFSVQDALSTVVGTGTGQAEQANTVAGPTSGKLFGVPGFFSAPVDADFTLSGTITFNFCGLESSMNANATYVANLYRVDSQGALTLIISSSLGTELGTTLARSSWTGTPTSTAMKKGDRLLLVPLVDDATAVTMGAGFTVNFQHNGAAASTADSHFILTETIGFLTAVPSATSYFLRDTASDVSGEKELSTTQGAGTATAVHTTINGPITFPGDQWTLSSGGALMSHMTPTLNAFTLGGLVIVNLGHASASGLETFGSPNDMLTVEIAVCDSDGSLSSVWARSYTGVTETGDTVHQVWLSGPDLAVTTGQRIRVRVYSDDYRDNAGSSQAAGTNRTIQYDGTTRFASAAIFSQTITEGAPVSAAGIQPIVTTQAVRRAAFY